LSAVVSPHGIARPLMWQIFSSLRLIPLPTDNFPLGPAFSCQLQNLHCSCPTCPSDVWTRHLGVTVDTCPSVGAASFHGSLPLDSLTALEQYSRASSQNGVFFTPNIIRNIQRERGMSSPYLHLPQTRCSPPSETSSARLFPDRTRPWHPKVEEDFTLPPLRVKRVEFLSSSLDSRD
jgi:hypothetical protein